MVVVQGRSVIDLTPGLKHFGRVNHLAFTALEELSVASGFRLDLLSR